MDVHGILQQVELDEWMNCQKGVEKFYEAIREDEVAVYSAEICIVTFDSKATCVMDFANLDRQAKNSAITTNWRYSDGRRSNTCS